MRSKMWMTSAIVIVSASALVGFGAMAMQEGHHGGDDALLKALPKSKFTLNAGIQQAAKGSAVPISAKFEMDDKGQLSLSVYTADKGLGRNAERNVLKELSGSPEAAAWTPETEIFKDVEHVARSAEQLTLMRLASKSLLDIVKQAEKSGTVFSITPVVEDRKGRFEVMVVAQGKAIEQAFDLDGKPIVSQNEDRENDGN